MTAFEQPTERSLGLRRTLVHTGAVTAVSSNLGFAVGVIGPSIRQDLGLSHAGLGLVPSLFFASTGFASIGAGHLVARSGTRRTTMLALAMTCGGCLFAGVVGSYLGLVLAAVLSGAGYSVVNVATNRIVRSASSSAELGRSMAIKTSGVPIATTTIAVIGGATARWGWRPAILVLAGFAAVAMLIALRFPRAERAARAAAVHAPLPRWFLLLPIAGFCAIAGSQPLYSWFAIYLHESMHVRTGTAAVISGVCTATGIPAMIGAARLSDHIGRAHRARFLAGLCGVGAVVMVVITGAHHLGIAAAVAGVAVGAAANLSIAGLFPALVVECAPHALERGSGVAMTGYFLGALASPVGFGALTDTAGGYPLAWLSAAGVCLVGAAGLLLIGGAVVGGRRSGGPVVADDDGVVTAPDVPPLA